VAAGAIVAALLSNDAAALVLTPVVYVLVARFGLSPLPYVLACTFVADAASIALPVSNPREPIIVSDRLGVSAASLVPVLLRPPSRPWSQLLGCLLVMYRRQLPARAPLVPPSELVGLVDRSSATGSWPHSGWRSGPSAVGRR